MCFKAAVNIIFITAKTAPGGRQKARNNSDVYVR